MRSARTASTSGISGAGLKKCSPRQRSGRALAAAIAVTEMAEVLVASTASLAADAVERREQLTLGADLLGDRLDHELAAGERGEIGA